MTIEGPSVPRRRSTNTAMNRKVDESGREMTRDEMMSGRRRGGGGEVAADRGSRDPDRGQRELELACRRVDEDGKRTDLLPVGRRGRTRGRSCPGMAACGGAASATSEAGRSQGRERRSTAWREGGSSSPATSDGQTSARTSQPMYFEGRNELFLPDPC